MTYQRPYTIFLDIDGCILTHAGSSREIHQAMPRCLEGVTAKFAEWESKGYRIILTTGRKESMREITEKQLSSFGLSWDDLIMGIGGGSRFLINDLKPDDETPTAIAINLPRNHGMQDIDLQAAIETQAKAMRGDHVES